MIIHEECIGCGACRKVCPVSAISGDKKELHLIDPVLCIQCGSCGRVCPSGAVEGEDGSRVERAKRNQWLKPVINREKCYACENCVGVCPVSALSMVDESRPLTRNYAVLSAPEACVSCGWCLENCQFEAINMEVIG